MAKRGEDDALRLAGMAYDAALSGQDWTGLLGSLAGRINARSAMLRLVDYRRRHVGFFDTYGYNPALPQAYRERYIELDPYRRLFETLPIGELRTADESLGAVSRRRGAFYNEYERPSGVEYLAGAALARNDDCIIQFGVHRTKRAGDFEPETRRFLERLLPHFVRAVQMRQVLAEASGRQWLAEATLDRLGLGVALADAQGRLLFVNQAAERLIAASKGALEICMRYLRPRDQNDAALLYRFIAEAATTTAGKALFQGGDVRVRCGDGSFLHLCVAPLARARVGSEFAAPTACAAVFIRRPGGFHLPWRKVAHEYGLTQAEARLAVHLAKGESPERAAEHLGVSLHTARSQLKAIFAKTGCKRQPELVAMLLQDMLAQCLVGGQES